MPTLYLGTLAHLRGDPFVDEHALEIIRRGALLVSADGRIGAMGDARHLADENPGCRIVDFGDAWLLPGLVDGHCHFPQFYATASHGKDLLDWLDRSIFPEEARYADPDYAREAAEGFVRRLLACGTATAMVFGSQFLEANLALFDAAKVQGLRLIAGMTLMDLGAPPGLLQSPSQAREQVETLMAHVQGDPMRHYAVTPRFALSCSEEMLAWCGDLLARNTGLYLQTHINESIGEIGAVRRCFPGDADYLAVYERHGLIGPHTMLAHDIHVSDGEMRRMAFSGCAVCHCPSSNLYLGSGLFPLQRHLAFGIRVAMGTDVGAGTRFSVWQELSEAYKVQQMLGFGLDAGKLLYMGTLGGARALGLQDQTGNFEAGKSADFWVLDASVSAYLPQRLSHCESLEDQLFALLHLATDRDVRANVVAGRMVHDSRWKLEQT
jgi:guanine deaminase